jgi:hypothetical protein
MTKSQRIAEIARVLITHGPVFSGGDEQSAERIAADWHHYGFGAESVDKWCSVGCWTASVAAEFGNAYMTPRTAARACQRYGQQAGGDAMYAACNADVPTEDIIAEYVAR